MLDGLLGRSGFYSKCKSLIKLTRQRIDVVKRKRNATQKFLRKDIADLLANGLDINAFGRAEGFITELILSSCYEFIDQVCEIILKALPVLQKLRECPEDCREAVASLMFAAARFSDLPELRDLRDLFQERYGNSLEYYVNPKLAENITPKPPSMEKKIQLMQEIASEFSLRWNSRAFEERMSKSSATEKNQQQSPVKFHAAASKVLTPSAEEIVNKTVKNEVLAKQRSEASYQNKEREAFNRYQKEKGSENILGRRDDLKHNVPRVPESPANRYKPPYREDTIQKREDRDISFQRRGPKSEVCASKENNAVEAVQVGTSQGKRLESVDSHHRHDKHREDLSKTLLQQKLDPLPVNNGINFQSTVDNGLADDIQVESRRKADVTDGFKTNIRSAIPPPYVKPRKSKHKTVDLEADLNDTLTFNPGSNGNKSEKVLTKPDPPDCQDKVAAPENVDGQGRFTEIYYRDTSSSDITPKRRSHRKKHSRSMSSQDEKLKGEVAKEEERVIRRVSTSRRKHESRKGLQILFDDDHYKKDGRHKKDDEEKMIDKLLLHYSKKPSSGDPRKSRKKPNGEMNDASKSPYHKAVDRTNVDEEDSTPTTSRSMSLPSRHVTEEEPQKKVFMRASSFQQDIAAKHVHPKLPDYDDLAARFAALRSSKD